MDDRIIHGPEITGELAKISVGQQIWKSLKAHPNQKIINVTDKSCISFADLHNSSCKIANFLVALGLGRGDVITICSENSLHFHKPLLASFYTGIVASLINHTYVKDELQHALNIAKPKILFCSRLTFPKFQKLPNLKLFVLEDLHDVVQEYSGNFNPVDFDSADTTAAIVYSSGTTGVSKGVMVTHANINFVLNSMVNPSYMPLDEQNFVVVPFYHVYGLIFSISALVEGNTVLFMEKFQEKLYLETLANYKIKSISAVPSLMVLLAKSPAVDQYKFSIEEVLSSSAPLSKTLEDEVKRRLKAKVVRQAYGLTEATLGVLSTPKERTKSGSCGVVMPGISVKIRDPRTGKTLGTNEIGEICVKGMNVTKGYYGNERATRDAFTKDGWLLTGDMAYYDEDKYFYLVDRLKDLIKYKGFQVAPSELEGLLLRHPKILDAGVVGLNNFLAGEVPVAFVVKKPGSELTSQEVVEYVKNNISVAKQLHGGVKFLEALPKNASGKLLRKDLRQMLKMNPKL